MNEQEEITRTPSQELTNIIVTTLLKSGLLHEGDAKRMAAAISSGKAKSEDWRITIEKVIDREKEGE
ncbi:MAG: hypothetical protein KZQ89_19180 [Candidatus Thiodiazotropha sp. (ex Lucinoma kastoroae)]|nr:hypothetical protein [Candidatus Thiodiazotropha sp. (ex Lucinoma kastoroae)]